MIPFYLHVLPIYMYKVQGLRLICLCNQYAAPQVTTSMCILHMPMLHRILKDLCWKCYLVVLRAPGSLLICKTEVARSLERIKFPTSSVLLNSARAGCITILQATSASHPISTPQYVRWSAILLPETDLKNIMSIRSAAP